MIALACPFTGLPGWELMWKLSLGALWGVSKKTTKHLLDVSRTWGPHLRETAVL